MRIEYGGLGRDGWRFFGANGASQFEPRATPWEPERACQPMPQSLARLHIHLIFSTKNREPALHDTVRHSLHRYMATVLQNLGCPPVLINSVADHVHILFELGRTVAVSDAVEQVKKTSSKWIKTQGAECRLCVAGGIRGVRRFRIQCHRRA